MKYISTTQARERILPYPRRIALMGSTGSIGGNALSVLRSQKDTGNFQVIALAAGHNIKLLAEQADEWRPPFLAIQEKAGEYGVEALKKLLPSGYHPEIFFGKEGFEVIAGLDRADMILSAQSGAAGLRSTVAAAAKGKHICLANKESLVLAGDLIRYICSQSNAFIFPVDSEHYALFESMKAHTEAEVSRLIITASGGPFRTKKAEELSSVLPEHALKHPNWSMGAKITIDSATLMNKGLEVIEAYHLYQMNLDLIQVIVHPQSVIHSLVEYKDGSLIAQMAVPDMRIPIAASFSSPCIMDRQKMGISPLELIRSGNLTFEEPRYGDFPCLNLAKEALKTGKTVQMNAANEIAVSRFLHHEIRFTDIPLLIKSVIDSIPDTSQGDFSEGEKSLTDVINRTLIQIEKTDAEARVKARDWHKKQ